MGGDILYNGVELGLLRRAPQARIGRLRLVAKRC